MLADKARAYVRENFSLGEMVRKTEEVYEEVLACRD
jgi:glycosyltransferase involved in cell wall biosynthesis